MSFVFFRWYHGSLSRSDAEALLTLCKECSYLVRTSQNNRSNYSLSLRYDILQELFCCKRTFNETATHSSRTLLISLRLMSVCEVREATWATALITQSPHLSICLRRLTCFRSLPCWFISQYSFAERNTAYLVKSLRCNYCPDPLSRPHTIIPIIPLFHPTLGPSLWLSVMAPCGPP